MSKKSRKGKKMNKLKLINACFRQATKSSYTMYGSCMDQPVMTEVGIGKDQLPFFSHWVAKTKFDWKTWMCVFAVADDGTEYIKQEIHAVPFPMASDETSAYMTKFMIKLVDSVPAKHLVSSGYVNTYNDYNLAESIDDLVEMFRSYGAFDIKHCEDRHAKTLMRVGLEEMAA